MRKLRQNNMHVQKKEEEKNQQVWTKSSYFWIGGI